MSRLQNVSITSQDTTSVDAFGRWRVSNPETIFDSKQIFDNAPLFWDEALESGAGITATYTKATASTVIASTLNTAGVFTRQTFMRFNYQPGKAVRHGEPVLTPDGWVAIEDVGVGDTVFDGLGKATEVVGVYPQGKRKIYRITFDDKTHVDCDGEHLWKTIVRQNSKKGTARILTTNQMLEEYGEEPPAFARWRIPAAPVLDMGEQEVPIDPYTLGAILGDGHITDGGSVVFTTADLGMLEHLVCEKITKHKYRYNYGLLGLSQSMRMLGLAGKGSHTKFIPHEYKFNSKEVRFATLRGLMDTDGAADKRDGTAHYTSVSSRLAEDVSFLVRSLGGQAKTRVKKTHYLDDNGDRVECSDAYCVSVIMPVCPFLLERKAFYWKPRTRISFDRYVHTIKEIGEYDATCIRVASEDHTFLTRGHIVTHNSQLIMMTGILDRSGGGAGVEREIGFGDDDNGLFFADIEGVVNVVRRTSVTGAPVDNPVPQPDWNIDVMDGTGPSGITADWTKVQIFAADFEWLSAGRVRMFLIINGQNFEVHEFEAANVLDKAFMSTPNLPCRYRMTTTAASPASTMEAICSSVVSEAGTDDLGVLRYVSTAGTHVDAAAQNVLYAIVGLRLKAANIAATINLVSVSIAEHQGTNEYEWLLILNPTVAGAFVYAGLANSSIEFATGATANTVTLGTTVGGGYGSSAQKGGNTVAQEVESAFHLGASIAGIVDEIVLCVRPVGGSTGIDIEAGITFRELS